MDSPLPLVATVLTALLVASMMSAIALRSDTAGDASVAGEWRIAFAIQRAPAEARIGETVSCDATLEQAGPAIKGEVTCAGVARTTEVTGFASPARNEVFLSTQAGESTTEVVANVASSVQMTGTWESSQGFAGRFVAIRRSAG